MIKDLILKNRSYRRFKGDHKIDRDILKELVGLARLSPSAGNKQPLKFFLSAEDATNNVIFPHLAWAGYLTDWEGPKEGERPTAYIVILLDKNIAQTTGGDHGIAAQSIMLGAVEKGLHGCMIGSIKKNELAEELKLPENLSIELVLALGEPAEEVVIETVEGLDDIKYWRDKEDVHHVPKRSLEDIIL